jgi:L-cysteine S-thiosulfotransferase
LDGRSRQHSNGIGHHRGRVSAVPEYLRLRTSAALLLATLSVIASRASGTEIPAAEKRSDYEFMSPETRAIQDDDTVNPGMFSVLDGEGLWSRKDGAPNVSCADCHTTESLRGLAARYPTFAPDYKRPVDLQERINICHARRQNATPFRFDSRELLALTAFVAHQSRGVPVQVTIDERLKPFFDAGRELFEGRQGQLNLSCAQCHDDNWGKRLAGNIIPQAQPTGYPVYRLEWQEVGSLQRRLRNCLIGMRAEPYPDGAIEYVELELYMTWRANGLRIETPAVRP